MSGVSVSLQQFQVVATENLNPLAVEAHVDRALATEKLDGTCCYVTLNGGESDFYHTTLQRANCFLSELVLKALCAASLRPIGLRI